MSDRRICSSVLVRWTNALRPGRAGQGQSAEQIKEHEEKGGGGHPVGGVRKNRNTKDQTPDV